MASAYADDLRRKFYAAYQRGGRSLPVLARDFGVSLGWAEKILHTVRQTGRIERPAGGKRGPKSKLTPEVRKQLGEWIAGQADLTLAELQIRLRKQRQIEVSLSRLWTVLKEMGLGLKKSHSGLPSRTNRRPRLSVESGSSKAAGSKARG